MNVFFLGFLVAHAAVVHGAAVVHAAAIAAVDERSVVTAAERSVLKEETRFHLSKHGDECVLKQEGKQEGMKGESSFEQTSSVRFPHQTELLQLDFYCIRGSRATKHRVDYRAQKRASGSTVQGTLVHTGIFNCDRCVGKLKKRRNFLQIAESRDENLRERVRRAEEARKAEEEEVSRRAEKNENARKNMKLFDLNPNFLKLIGEGNDSFGEGNDGEGNDGGETEGEDTDQTTSKDMRNLQKKAQGDQESSENKTFSEDKTSFGPDACLQVWKNEHGSCVIGGEKCQPETMRSADVGFGCVLESGDMDLENSDKREKEKRKHYSVTKHTYGLNSYASFVRQYSTIDKTKDETKDFIFNTHTKCSLCVGLDDDLEFLGKSAEINQDLMRTELRNLKKSLESVTSKDFLDKKLGGVSRQIAEVQKEIQYRDQMSWGTVMGVTSRSVSGGSSSSTSSSIPSLVSAGGAYEMEDD